jgi:two-component system, LytTR family, sensor kinase
MKLSLENKWLVATIHIITWIVVFSLPYMLHPSYENTGNGKDHPGPPPFNLLMASLDLIWVGLFYLNAYVLVPVYINHRRYWQFVGTIVVAFFAIMLLHWGLFKTCWPDEARGKRDFKVLLFINFNISFFTLVLAASTAYRMLTDKIKADSLEKEKQKEYMKTELSFLRSQISPHFIFNVLNNIVALARLKSEKLEPTIFQLSGLMRYMLYESDEKKVSLQKEADYLQSYINLQQLRFGNKVAIEVHTAIPDGALEVEPMLLVPFVENAFKHGTTYVTAARIEINLSVIGRTLYFSVRNKFSTNKNETQDETSGIGLANVKRRLNLLYPGEHVLQIVEEGEWFSVSLQLTLHDITMHSH